MLNTFQANFYHGVKPIAKMATVQLLADHFRIDYLEGDQLKSTIWEVTKIIPDDKPDDKKIILQYISNSDREFIEVVDPSFLSSLQMIYPHTRFIKVPGPVAKSALMVLSIFSGVVILGILMLYFFAVPWLSGVIAKQVPKNWEVDMGEQMFKGMAKNLEIDSAKTILLDSFFSELKINSQYTIKVHYAKDEVVNAFAMPGGHIVVYSGILNKMKNYSQLVGLMGHEFTHVEKQHSLQSLFRSLSSYTLISIILGDLSGVAAVLAENANAIQNLSYSREFEIEADKMSYEIMTDRQLDPNGLTDLFQLLKENAASTSTIPKFLSSHPLTDERIIAVNTLMKNNQQKIVHREMLSRLFEELKK